jgi:metallo-beta-lactamase class B
VSRALLAVMVVACGSQPPRHDAEIHGAWSAPVAPFRVAEDIYYVGAKHIASYLIATRDGLVVIDTGTREMVPVVRDGIAKLGFALADVKILLCTHAHFDHVGGHAAIQRATGARVMVMRGDAEAVATGVDRSPLAGEGWEPVRVDRILDDGDRVELGGVSLQAIAAPGHTPGCTVWLTRAGDRSVAIYGCARPNDGVRLIGNPRFPHLVEDTRATFAQLRALAPDLALITHPDDPAELLHPRPWPALLDEAEAEFAAQLAKQR